MNIPSKLPNIGTTIFTVMSQLAAEKHAINLGQGFPDFNPDQRLIDLVSEAMNQGHNQYPPMAGIMPLRQAISEKVARLHGHRYDPVTDITVTAGASEGLFVSILALVHPGDEVIIIEPFYDLYVPAIRLAGGKPVSVPMSPPTESRPRYAVDWDRVQDAVTSRTRLLILNFPHNPTGINLHEPDLDALEAIVHDNGLFILSDEVYEHLTYDGIPHLSMANRPSLAERSVIVSSFGKTYSATGWKIGYSCAPTALSAELRKVHQFNTFTVSTPMQVGLATYMQNDTPYLQLSGMYQKKRDRLSTGLASTRLKPLPTEGTFFLLADYSAVSDLPEAEFAIWLTEHHGVSIIPVSAFYEQPDAPSSNHKLARFCFAKQDATLDLAIEKLQAL